MLIIAAFAACLLLVASFPYWLPAAILKLRMRIFTGINADQGIAIPGRLVDVSHFKQVYSHAAANGRSRGAALSDLFWYWLSPGPEMHQEHIEPGERYDEVARATQRILAISRKTAEELTRVCVTRLLSDKNLQGATLVRLRDLMMPIWAEFYYELVFRERCPRAARDLIVGNANDVVTALKCCGLRHMKKRERLTRFLMEKIETGKVPHPLPARLSTQEKAFYLQGVFFNTAIVQMSEAMVHLLLVLAQHSGVQSKIVADLDNEDYLDAVITETLRLYPLFGIAHRITSNAIAVDEQIMIPKGAVVCFNYPEFHKAGFENAETFYPERWQMLSTREANYIPFGVPANRSCPAQGLVPVTMRVAVRELLRRLAFYSTASHTRSIPSRGPCLIVPRTERNHQRPFKALLCYLRIRDRWEDVWRSFVQLVLGTYMVCDARRLRLCEHYFETHAADLETAKLGPTPAVCPISHR